MTITLNGAPTTTTTTQVDHETQPGGAPQTGSVVSELAEEALGVGLEVASDLVKEVVAAAPRSAADAPEGAGDVLDGTRGPDASTRQTLPGRRRRKPFTRMRRCSLIAL